MTVEPANLYAALAQFSGSDSCFRYTLIGRPVKLSSQFGPLMVTYTEGVKYLAKHAKAYWLLDEIVLGLKSFVGGNQSAAEFHLWTLTKKGSGALLEARVDKGEPAVYTKRIPYTDFPFPDTGEFKLYGSATEIAEGPVLMLMLPGER